MPHEWNMGAAIIVGSSALSGIFENSEAIGSIESGCLRCAPFGVPVVPEVRMTMRPFSSGGSRPDGSPEATRSSSTRVPRGLLGVVPADIAAQPLRGVVAERLELGVVQDRLGLLAAHDVGDLGRREHRVEVERR